MDEVQRTKKKLTAARERLLSTVDGMDKEQWEFVRIVEERDTSTGLGQLLVNLYDATMAMEELDPDLVDMSDPDQEAVFRTVRILEDKVIYADSYLQV